MSTKRIAVCLRVVIVQLNPQIGQVQQTLSRTWEILDKFKEQLDSEPHTKFPDLVVFPEFALTGYNFKSKDHIQPFLSSSPTEGPSFDLASKVSEMFNCYTVIGYPERHIDKLNNESLYNSAVVVNPKGEMVFNYRKSFLYYTDEDWGCEENPKGFQTFSLAFPGRGKDVKTGTTVDVLLKSSIGICMDLSPYKFEAPFHDYEFATYNLDNSSELIICPMAWLHASSYSKNSNKTEAETITDIKCNLARQHLFEIGSQGNYKFNFDQFKSTEKISRESKNIVTEYTNLEEPDMYNINYWILRFLPFLSLESRKNWFHDNILFSFLKGKSNSRKSYIGCTLSKPWEFEGNNSILILANRCGVEDTNTVFAGSSGIYKFNGQNSDIGSKMDSTNRSVELLGNLGKCYEGIIMRDVEFEVKRK